MERRRRAMPVMAALAGHGVLLAAAVVVVRGRAPLADGPEAIVVEILDMAPAEIAQPPVETEAQPLPLPEPAPTVPPPPPETARAADEVKQAVDADRPPVPDMPSGESGRGGGGAPEVSGQAPDAAADNGGDISVGAAAVVSGILCARTAGREGLGCPDMPAGEGWGRGDFGERVMAGAMTNPTDAQFIPPPKRRMSAKHPGAVQCGAQQDQREGALNTRGFYFLPASQADNLVLSAVPDPVWCD